MILARTDLPMGDRHPDYPALIAGNYVLGGGMLKSRLADRIRQKDGLSYGVGSQFGADPIDDDASLQLFAIAAPENIAKVDAAFREEIARLIEKGVEGDELTDAVDGLIKARQRSRGEDGALVSQLREGLYLDRTMPGRRSSKQAGGAHPGAVQQALKKHFGLGG